MFKSIRFTYGLTINFKVHDTYSDISAVNSLEEHLSRFKENIRPYNIKGFYYTPMDDKTLLLVSNIGDNISFSVANLNNRTIVENISADWILNNYDKLLKSLNRLEIKVKGTSGHPIGAQVWLVKALLEKEHIKESSYER